MYLGKYLSFIYKVVLMKRKITPYFNLNINEDKMNVLYFTAGRIPGKKYYYNIIDRP